MQRQYVKTRRLPSFGGVASIAAFATNVQQYYRGTAMIIVHDTFVCKPGQASKLAKLFKEAMANEKNISIMTDMTGQYNRVVMASWYENLAAWEKSAEAYANPTPEMKASMDKMKGYTDMYLTGSREVFRTW